MMMASEVKTVENNSQMTNLVKENRVIRELLCSSDIFNCFAKTVWTL